MVTAPGQGDNPSSIHFLIQSFESIDWMSALPKKCVTTNNLTCFNTFEDFRNMNDATRESRFTVNRFNEPVALCVLRTKVQILRYKNGPQELRRKEGRLAEKGVFMPL